MAIRSPLRWFIGSELKRHREEAGMSRQEASARSGVTAATINNLERGNQAQEPEYIAALLTAYGRPPRDVDRLCDLTGRASEANWYGRFAVVLPDWFKTYLGLEGLADSAFAYEPTVIPGLLQTQEYAATVAARVPHIRPSHSERFVKVRVARSRRLTDDERPLHLHVVIAEAALRMAVGDCDLRRAQYRHLLEIAKLPTVTLQVLRPDDGLHTALTGPFTILNFAEEVQPLAYVELHNGALYVQDPEQLEAYTMVAQDLKQVALGPEASLSFLEAMDA